MANAKDATEHRTWEGDVVVVEVEQCERTGRYAVACPRCEMVMDRLTNHGVLEALERHVNEWHGEEAGVGHA